MLIKSLVSLISNPASAPLVTDKDSQHDHYHGIYFTFVGADKPGLVEQLVKTVGQHGGDWLESRMSELAGQSAGIVREVAVALAARQINVREMETPVSSADMSGAPLFQALVHIQVPKALYLAELNSQLDAIANALTLDIDLEESLR